MRGCAGGGGQKIAFSGFKSSAAADGEIIFSVGADPDVQDFCATDNIEATLTVSQSGAPSFYPVGTSSVTFTTKSILEFYPHTTHS